MRLALDDAWPGDQRERAAAATDCEAAYLNRIHPVPLYGPPKGGHYRGSLRDRFRRGANAGSLMPVAGFDEAGKQRMRARWLRLELRMELHGEEPRMAR